MLLAVIGYQSANRPAGSTAGPRLLSTISLISANARGETATGTPFPQGTSFVVYVDVPPTENARSFSADFLSAGGVKLWTLPLPADASKDTLTLQIPPVSGPAGTYTLVVRAVDANGQSRDLNRYRLTMDQR
jgi:hypothetical protein